MAAPASVNTQAVSPGDLAYLTAHHGTAQADQTTQATAMYAEQFASTATATQTSLQADKAALTAIAAYLTTNAGAHTGAAMQTYFAAIRTILTGRGRTAGVVTYSGS